MAYESAPLPIDGLNSKPTFADVDWTQPSKMEDYYSATEEIAEVVYMQRTSSDQSKRTLRRQSKTVEDLQRNLNQQQAPFNAYDSDEEIASPIGSDDVDLPSPNDSLSSISDSSNSEWECDQATRARFVPAGTVKLISINIPRKRPALDTPPFFRTNSSKRVQTEADNNSVHSHHRNSSGSSAADSIQSTPPSSVPSSPEVAPTRKLERHLPSVPLLQAVSGSTKRPQSVYSTEQQSKNLSLTSNSIQRVPVDPHRLRKKNKFSTPHISSLGRITRPKNEVKPSENESSPNIHDAPADSEVRPQLAPLKTSGRPKMVARAANERAPPPMLPPCPDDYSNDDAVISCQRAKALAAWHQRERYTRSPSRMEA